MDDELLRFEDEGGMVEAEAAPEPAPDAPELQLAREAYEDGAGDYDPALGRARTPEDDAPDAPAFEVPADEPF